MADKVVYSKSLEPGSSKRTRLVRAFDADEVRRIKASSARDISVGGPTPAAEALAAGLIDEMHLFLNPVLVGSGTPMLPDKVRVALELLAERRFENEVVHLHYRVGERFQARAALA